MNISPDMCTTTTSHRMSNWQEKRGRRNGESEHFVIVFYRSPIGPHQKRDVSDWHAGKRKQCDLLSKRQFVGTLPKLFHVPLQIRVCTRQCSILARRQKMQSYACKKVYNFTSVFPCSICRSFVLQQCTCSICQIFSQIQHTQSAALRGEGEASKQ